jgi:hypothetical protein
MVGVIYAKWSSEGWWVKLWLTDTPEQKVGRRVSEELDHFLGKSFMTPVKDDQKDWVGPCV